MVRTVGVLVMFIIGTRVRPILAHVLISKSSSLKLVVGISIANASMRLAHLRVLWVVEESRVVLHGHAWGKTC